MAVINTSKRDKIVIQYLKKQIKRLNYNDQSLISEYMNTESFKDETSFIEVVKIIGIMEVSENAEEFERLYSKRKKLKTKNEDISEFDKVLKGILNVSNKKEEK